MLGAVFDMDGLMFDSERLVFEIWRDMLAEDGYDFNLNIFRKTMGLRRDESEKVYKSVYGENFDYESRKNQSRAVFKSRILKDGVPVKKGLFELLDFLKKNNIKMAVATSTSAETAHWAIKLSGAYDYFDAFVCGNEVPNGKPAPDVFLKAAEKIGVPPKECAAFEDSINGIKAAYEAGMFAIMVPDLIQPDDVTKNLASAVCKSLDEAIPILKRINYNLM